MDHSQQNCGILGYWYGHDCRGGGCLCPYGHLGPCLEQKSLSMKNINVLVQLKKSISKMFFEVVSVNCSFVAEEGVFAYTHVF